MHRTLGRRALQCAGPRGRVRRANRALTPGPRPGSQCAFSPYTDQLLCCASAQYFGISGNGAITVFAVGEGAAVRPIARFPTQDGSFDVAWSEAVREQVASVSGDGSVYLWDMRSADALPIRRWAEHGAEAVAIAWNGLDRSTFLTGAALPRQAL